MRGLRWLVMAFVIAVVVVGAASAQSVTVKLVARAVLPAESFAEGPPSGASLAAQKSINGVRVPFSNQPASSFSSIIRGTFKGTWWLLTDKGFGSANSADFLLRGYTIETDWRRETAGSGTVALLDWTNLSDPRKTSGFQIQLDSADGRPLTGADFDPRSVVRAPDGTLWVGEAKLPSLLHFSKDGVLLEVPRPISGGALQGLSITPDGSQLVVALRAGSGVLIGLYDPTQSAVQGSVLTYPLDAPSNNVGDLVMINPHQALVIEQDNQQGQNARTKLIYLIDLNNAPNGVFAKQLVADLLNIADPANIATNAVFGPQTGQFGLKPYKFPYQDVSSVYPLDSKTLVVINNNHFPFSTGRAARQADYSEFIAIQLATPLDVQLKDSQE
jgi:hypothetical protein